MMATKRCRQCEIVKPAEEFRIVGRMREPTHLKRLNTEQRFWQKVERTEGCWLWRAALRRGYGEFHVDGRVLGAHRVSWEMVHGPIPPEMELDHAVCGTKACVNPNHLELVAIEGRENTRRYVATITHCPRGHPYDEQNTIRRPLRSGGVGRVCRACNTAWFREFRRRRKAGPST